MIRYGCEKKKIDYVSTITHKWNGLPQLKIHFLCFFFTLFSFWCCLASNAKDYAATKLCEVWSLQLRWTKSVVNANQIIALLFSFMIYSVQCVLVICISE